jgi:hypothetical protein
MRTHLEDFDGVTFPEHVSALLDDRIRQAPALPIAMEAHLLSVVVGFAGLTA